MKATPAVSLIILAWRSRPYMKRCLAALARQSFRDFEVILVVNGSCDGALGMAMAAGLPLLVIEKRTNRGFSAGNNLALRRASGKYIALLNSDAEPDPAWLSEMVSALEAHPEAGMVACKVLMEDGLLLDNTGHLLFPDGLNWGRGRGERDWGQYDGEEEALFPSGCAALFRREVIEGAGGFDPFFFAYGEDADMGLKGRLSGWRCIYAPKAKVRHTLSSGLGSHSVMKAFFVERGRLFIAFKFLPWPEILLSPVYTLGRFLLYGYGLFRGKGLAGKYGTRAFLVPLAMGAAYLSALPFLPHLLKERRRFLRQEGVRKMRDLMKRFRARARAMALSEF